MIEEGQFESSEQDQDIEIEPNKLPPDASLIHTYNITHKEVKVDLPIYEIPERDTDGQIERYRYYQGWPKIMLSGSLKSLVESTPYWGTTNIYEDDDYYYYLTRSREPNEKIPKDKITQDLQFRFRQAKKAFSFLKRT